MLINLLNQLSGAISTRTLIEINKITEVDNNKYDYFDFCEWYGVLPVWIFSILLKETKLVLPYHLSSRQDVVVMHYVVVAQ